MIELILKLAGDYILVRIDGNSITFSNTAFGTQAAPIEGLKLSQAGAIKLHPDLKDREDWKEEAIKRFKEKVKAMPSEIAVANYIMDDLKQWGYLPLYRQRAGFRREKLGSI